MTDEEFNAWKWEKERREGSFKAQTEAFMPREYTNKEKPTASSMRDEDFPEDYFGSGDDR